VLRQDECLSTVLLIAEDPMVALDFGDALREAGYRIAGPLTSQADALAWMAWRRPDLAVLDLPLRDGDGSRVARVLRMQGVPFLIHADGTREGASCAALRAAPRLTRPAWPRDLVHVLGQLIREARS